MVSYSHTPLIFSDTLHGLISLKTLTPLTYSYTPPMFSKCLTVSQNSDVSETLAQVVCVSTDLAGLVRSERLSEGGRAGRGPRVVGAEWRGAGGRHGAGGEGRVVQGVLTGVNTRGLAAH